MQHINHSLKSNIAFILLIGLFLMSCSEATDTAPSDNDSMRTSEEGDYSLADIDTNQVLAWYDMRTNAENVQNCLNALTNHFSIVRPDSTVDSIYLYIGYDSETQTLSLYPIPSFADTTNNLKCLPISTLKKGAKIDLPITVATDTTRKNAISLKEAKARINFWKSDTTRNAWISAVCNNQGAHIGQIYVISTIDMVPSDKHDCYLSLKQDASAVGGFKGDLIIVNTRTNEILQPAPVVATNTTGALEDVVKLGPPFKGIDLKKFGLLNTLKIK